MGFLGLNFNNKYKDMLSDLSGYINSSEFKDMPKEKKEELYADYCLLKKLMQDNQEELKKIYFGSADSISRLWPTFMKSKREINEININAPGTTTLEKYFLSDFITKSQIKAASLTKSNEGMQKGFDEILSHPAIDKKYQKYSFSSVTNPKKDEVVFEQILDEQTKKVLTTINTIKSDIEQKNVGIGMSSADCDMLMQQIQQNGNIENIKISIIVLMTKYKEIISSDAMSCKTFFDGIDPYFLTDYVINEKGRQEMEDFFFQSNKKVSKL